MFQRFFYYGDWHFGDWLTDFGDPMTFPLVPPFFPSLITSHHIVLAEALVWYHLEYLN